MTSFSIEIEFDMRHTNVSDNAASALVDALRDIHGAVGAAPNGNLSVIVTLNATSAINASTLAADLASAAVIAVTSSPTVITGITTMTEDEADRRLADDDQDDQGQDDEGGEADGLAGIAETCDILGVSEAGLRRLTDELTPHLATTRASGPLYRVTGLLDIARRHPLPPLEQALLNVIGAKHAPSPNPDPYYQRAKAALVLDETPIGTRTLVRTSDAQVRHALAALLERGLVVPAPETNETLTGAPDLSSAVVLTARGHRHSRPLPTQSS